MNKHKPAPTHHCFRGAVLGSRVRFVYAVSWELGPQGGRTQGFLCQSFSHGPVPLSPMVSTFLSSCSEELTRSFLSVPFSGFPNSYPHPSSEGIISVLPRAGGLQKATSMEGSEPNPGASFPSCVHIPGQRQNCRVGRALGSRQVTAHVADLEMEPQGVQRACSQSAHVWTSRILGAAHLSPCAVDLGVESQFPTRGQARCCRLSSDKPAMGSVSGAGSRNSLWAC